MPYTTYKQYKLRDGTLVTDSIKVSKTSDHPDIYIPFVAENTDYPEYLKWVAAGNTADAAD